MNCAKVAAADQTGPYASNVPDTVAINGTLNATHHLCIGGGRVRICLCAVLECPLFGGQSEVRKLMDLDCQDAAILLWRGWHFGVHGFLDAIGIYFRHAWTLANPARLATGSRVGCYKRLYCSQCPLRFSDPSWSTRGAPVPPTFILMVVPGEMPLEPPLLRSCTWK